MKQNKFIKICIATHWLHTQTTVREHAKIDFEDHWDIETQENYTFFLSKTMMFQNTLK